MTEAYLGRPVPIALGGPGNQAKRAVMLEACANRAVRPTFSRMSGIQQWANAVFLFVNVGGASGFDNVFLDGGRRVTWFAQATQTEVSPVILRLIHHASGYAYDGDSDDGDDVRGGKGGERGRRRGAAAAGGAGPGASRGGGDDGSDGSDDAGGAGLSFLPPAAVCLICRTPEQPYVWMGELAYESHAPGTRPLKFVWRLKDFGAGVAHAGFQRIVAAGSGG
jgi:hypothetical protein